jgi:hypothetical protein
LDIVAFKTAANTHFLGLYSDDNKVSYYQLGKTNIVVSLTWNLLGTQTTKFRLEQTILKNIDRTAQQAMGNIGCIPSVDGKERNMIMFYSDNNVFINGFNPDSGNIDINLDPATSKGKNLYYSTVRTITGATVYGECAGDTQASTQQLWLVIASSLQDTDYKVDFIPLTEFSNVDFTCPGDWVTNPSGLVKNNGVCVVMDTACADAPNEYQQSTNGVFSCKTRVTTDSQTISGSGTKVVVRLSKDTKTTTLPEDIYFSYINMIFITSTNHIDVFGLQEAFCQKDTKPNVFSMGTIQFSENLNEIAVSSNAQHMFTTLDKRDWEIDANNKLIQICSILSSDPTNQFYKQFLAECKQKNPIPFTIYDFIKYHSQCKLIL